MDYVKLLKDSITIYRKNLHLIIPLLGVFILALIITFISSQPSYLAFGFVLLRTSTISFVDTVQLLLFLVSFLIITFLTSVFFTGTALLVKAEKVSIKKYILEEIFTRRFYKVFLFFLLISSIGLFFSLISFLMSIPPLLSTITMLIIVYISFFIPYALVIDDYNLEISIKKGISFLKEHITYPLIWSLTYLLPTLIISAFLSFIVDYTIAQYLVFFISTVFFMPFLIILGSLMYVKKYRLLGD